MLRTYYLNLAKIHFLRKNTRLKGTRIDTMFYLGENEIQSVFFFAILLLSEVKRRYRKREGNP